MVSPLPPQWIIPGAKFDMDYKNWRFWGTSQSLAANNASYQRGDTALGPGNSLTQAAPDDKDVLQLFGSGVPRITKGRGMWVEGRYRNSALWSRDFTNAAWVKTNVTAAKNQPGADAVASATGASSLTATSNGGTCLQSIVLASAICVTHARIRRLVGTGTIEMTQDNGSTWTDVTAQIGSVYARVSIPSATLANPVVGFRFGTSGDSIAVDYFQCENNTYPSSPLATTSASVFRGTEEPCYNDAGVARTNDGQRLIRDVICDGGPWWWYMEASGNCYSTGGQFILSDGGLTVAGGCDGGPATFKGVLGGNTATSGNNGVFGLGNINKMIGRVNGFGPSICLNAGAVASNPGGTLFNSQSTGFTHIGVGNNGAGVFPVDGYIARIAVGQGEISDGFMIENTRL